MSRLFVGDPDLKYLILGIGCVIFFIAECLIFVDLGKSFNKSIAFILGLIFLSPLFLVILGADDSSYCGKNAIQTNENSTDPIIKISDDELKEIEYYYDSYVNEGSTIFTEKRE